MYKLIVIRILGLEGYSQHGGPIRPVKLSNWVYTWWHTGKPLFVCCFVCSAGFQQLRNLYSDYGFKFDVKHNISTRAVMICRAKGGKDLIELSVPLVFEYSSILF